MATQKIFALVGVELKKVYRDIMTLFVMLLMPVGLAVMIWLILQRLRAWSGHGLIPPLPRIPQLMTISEASALQELCDAVDQQRGLRVSVPTMCTWLQRLGLGEKKSLHASERDTPKLQKARRQFQQRLRGCRRTG